MLSWILRVGSEHENFIHKNGLFDLYIYIYILHFLVLEIFDFKM